MKTAPESRAIDDPMLTDRVRGVRYEPISYNEEERTHSRASDKELTQTAKSSSINKQKSDREPTKKSGASSSAAVKQEKPDSKSRTTQDKDPKTSSP